MTRPENVKCPICDGPMISRQSKYGVFWGCASYPKCKGTRDSMGMSKADKAKEKGEDEEVLDNVMTGVKDYEDRHGFTFRKKNDC